jgi:hypothetical protein
MLICRDLRPSTLARSLLDGGNITALPDAFPSGSFLALSHPARAQVAVAVRAETSLTRSTGQKATFRTRDQVSELAAGLDLAVRARPVRASAMHR